MIGRIVALCFFTLPFLTEATKYVDFPESPIFNYSGTIDFDEQVVFNLTLWPSREFIFIRTNVTTPEGYNTLLHLEGKNGTVIDEWFGTSEEATGWEYFWLQPSTTGRACIGAFTANEEPCTFKLIITASWPESTNLRLDGFRGQMLPYGQTVTGELHRGRSSYYGTEVTDDDLSVVVTMQPNSQLPAMDLDITCLAASKPFRPFFPSNLEKNHYYNAEERCVIEPGRGYVGPGLYVVEVLASTDSKYTENSYTLKFERRYTDDVAFGLSLLGIVTALTALLICLFFAGAVLYKRQRVIQEAIMTANALNAELVAQAASQPPRQNNGATAAQLAALKSVPFTAELMPAEDARCTICLTEYEPDILLRYLPCGHHFDQPCADAWLKQKRWCPLCQQDIQKASDVTRKPQSPTTNGPSGVNDGEAASEIELTPVVVAVVPAEADGFSSPNHRVSMLRSLSPPSHPRPVAATSRQAHQQQRSDTIEPLGRTQSNGVELAAIVQSERPPPSPTVLHVQLPGSGEVTDFTIHVNALNGASTPLSSSSSSPALSATASVSQLDSVPVSTYATTVSLYPDDSPSDSEQKA